MDARRPLVAGNWKMYKTIAESVAFVRELAALAPDLRDVDALICPPFTALSATHEALAALPAVGLGAQTMWDTDQGAYTGEISPVMLLDAGARWVILGHSERRQLCGETDAGVNRKVIAALRAGLTPIVAVGETAEEHAAGRTQARVTAQARAAFAGVAPSEVGRCVVAYAALSPTNRSGRSGAERPTVRRARTR
jgi:triosephosphate isomerase